MSKASGGRPGICRRARSSTHGRQLTRPGDTPGQHPPAACRPRAASSLRDSALTPLTGGNGFFVALSCGFLLDGWLAWCLIPHPMDAVTMAGGLWGTGRLEPSSLPWIEDARCGAWYYARLVRGPGDHVLAWAAQAVAPGARVTQAAGLREGGNPWLLRLERAGKGYRAVVKTGDPARARDRMQLRTQVAALALARDRGLPGRG